MRKHIEAALRWTQNAIQDNATVQGEATLESLRRFRVFSVVVVLVNIAYMVEFWWRSAAQDSPARVAWANAIGWTHCVMAVFTVVLGLLIHRLLRRNTRSSAAALALQLLCVGVSLSFAIGLSVADQMVSANTTNFAMTSLLVGMLFLMRPIMSLAMLGGAYMVLYFAMALTQPDINLLGMARSHAFGAVLVSFVASCVVWYQYAASVLLRREIVRSHHALASKQTELEFLATHDALTGLHNRREFMRLAEMEMARIARVPADVCLVMVDLDFFKRVNDQHGHPAGDEVLRQFAGILKSGARATDVVARLGGEEFIILLRNTPEKGAVAVAEKIRSALGSAPLQILGTPMVVTASFGVSHLPLGDSGTIDGLYVAADHAVYVAKKNGRDRVESLAYSAGSAPLAH